MSHFPDEFINVDGATFRLIPHYEHDIGDSAIAITFEGHPYFYTPVWTALIEQDSLGEVSIPEFNYIYDDT